MKSSLLSKVSVLIRKPKSDTRTLLHTSNHLHRETQKTHAYVLKSGIAVPESKIVQEYCQSEAFSDARQLFDETLQWEVVSATAIIGAFARHNRCRDAIAIFSCLLYQGIKPNQFTFSTLVCASTVTREHGAGKQLHACATKAGLQSNVFVGSSVVDHYAKLDDIENAQKAFDDISSPNVVSKTTLIFGYLKNELYDPALRIFLTMPEKNLVSWNAMIGGCSQTGQNEEAVNLFVEMCREGLRPNQSTFPCVLTAAANIAVLGLGRSLHSCAIKCLINCNVFVGNSLVSFYAKCGCMEDSFRAFNVLPERNVVSWNALISGYAQNGQGDEALDHFQTMQSLGARPNNTTLLCILFACTHMGLVDDGLAIFNLAREESSNLEPEHYACMVDLLSRSGRFNDAKLFLQQLPFDPGIGFWKALLVGCQTHSNSKLAEVAAQKILVLNPEDSSSYILLSNVYSSAGRWESVSFIRKEMKNKGMARIPGCSWIEVRNKIHIFVSRDRSHTDKDDINVILGICYEHMKETRIP